MTGKWEGQGHQDRLGKSGWQRQRDNRRILERDGHRCLCGQPATRVDHVVNLATRIDDDDANKRAMCDACHNKKTQAEAAAGRAPRPTIRRPPERHPGLR